MRIAYVVVWREGGTPSGVLRKVRSQVLAWLSLGHDARLFLISQDDAPWPPLRDVPLAFVHSPAIWTRPMAAERVRRELSKWRPDAVYLRQGTYYPAWEKMMSMLPTILEVNSDDLAQSAAVASRLRSNFHTLTRWRLLRGARGFACVTRELAESYSQSGKPTCAIGNGIDLSAYEFHPVPVSGPLRLVFIASVGRSRPTGPLDGVDKVVRLARRLPDIEVHVVGPRLNAEGLSIPANLISHGLLDRPAYDSVLAEATVGLGALALHRKQMQEASPLKVREYLAFGLPVVIGYSDTDFPEPRSFILHIPNTEDNVESYASEIERFAHAWQGKRVLRSEVEHLDVLHKEQERLAFVQDVLSHA